MSLLRLDRLLSLHLFRPIQRAGFGGRTFGIPILMYHSISEDEGSGVADYYRTNTSPAVFERQMRFLRDEGFHSVDLDQALRLLENQAAPEMKAFVITFDDGFRDFYTSAFPILNKYGFTATMYVLTGFIGDGRKSFKGRECLIWSEVRELRRQGIQFGSHSVSHPVLYELSWKEIESELTCSKTEVEGQLKEEVTSFAYPYAFPQQDRRFIEGFMELARASGYRNCVTTIIGRVKPGANQFCLKRLPANDCDDTALLAAKLQGAYDWLASPQTLIKNLKMCLRGSKKRDPGPAQTAQRRPEAPVSSRRNDG
jgi:peptidoglycan/xylan/chitin deacetylase (PgdA/CDA1 family)